MFSLSLPSVTTNLRCIGNQSSMKCVAPIGSYCSPCSQGWGDPEEWEVCTQEGFEENLAILSRYLHY